MHLSISFRSKITVVKRGRKRVRHRTVVPENKEEDRTVLRADWGFHLVQLAQWHQRRNGEYKSNSKLKPHRSTKAGVGRSSTLDGAYLLFNWLTNIIKGCSIAASQSRVTPVRTRMAAACNKVLRGVIQREIECWCPYAGIEKWKKGNYKSNY